MTDEPSPAPLPDFDALWDFSNPAATEEKFRELLPAAERSGDASCRLQLLTQIARAQGLQRKFDEAHATLDEVACQLDQAAPVVRVRYLLERGRVHNSSGHADESRPLFFDAWNIAQASGEDGLAVDAAHMLGVVCAADEALAWNERALALAESSLNQSARRWRGSLQNNLGWTYHDAGNYEKALELFEKALALRLEHEFEQKSAEPIRVARWCVARALRSLERTREALEIQQQLLAEHEQAGGKDGFVLEELGECPAALGRNDEARPFFAQAHAELSQDGWLVDHEPDRITRLKRLGESA